MGYTYYNKKKKSSVVKASRYTQAKKGYLGFKGQYPTMKSKFFTSKKKAIRWARR
jgi:hypothetical protein